MGDRYYSTGKVAKRDENKKVITEPRGIFTKPLKHGKNSDAYFSNLAMQDKHTLNQVKEMADKEHENYMASVRSRKKGANPESTYKAVFKPGGPQESKDL